MNTSLNTAIISCWLTEKEAVVYLAAYQLGSAPASSIARVAKQQRVTTYGILKKLCIQNIATQEKRGSTTFFRVISPEQLLSQHETKISEAKARLPELMALASVGSEIDMRVFTGMQWLITLYDLTLEKHDSPLYSILWNLKIDPRLDSYFFDTYVPRRMVQENFIYKILANNEDNQELHNNDKKEYRSSVLVDDFAIGDSHEIILFSDHSVAIALHTPDNMMGVLIQSKSLYMTLFWLFRTIWNSQSEEKL